jgi:Lar family restriction alleviation protein
VKEQMIFCPFCGAIYQEELTVSLSGKPGSAYRHFNVCCSCGATGPNADTKEKAVERWNERREVEQ